MSRTVLLVDPGVEALAKIGRFLEEFGFVVQTAGTRAEALDKVRVFDPGLLVVSLQLPDGDAFGLLDEIRYFFKSKVPVLITAPADQINERRRSSGGAAAQDWIVAPIDQMDFYNHINRWLGVEVDEKTEAKPAAPPRRTKPAARRLAALRSPSPAPPPIRSGTIVWPETSSESAPTPQAQPAGPAWRSKRPARRARDESGVLGNLARLPTPRLLARLAKDAETGVLQLNRSPYRMHVHFSRGEIVNVRSNYIPDLSLGMFLAKQGKISPGELGGARKRWEREGGLFGETLVAMELIEPEKLDQALREHWRRKLHYMFDWHWDKGIFIFSREAELVEPLERFRVDAAELIIDGVREAYDRERALRLLGRKRLNLRASLAADLSRLPNRGERNDLRQALNAIRAGQTLSAAQPLSGMGEADFLKTACALAALEMLTFHRA